MATFREYFGLYLCLDLHFFGHKELMNSVLCKIQKIHVNLTNSAYKQDYLELYNFVSYIFMCAYIYI